MGECHHMSSKGMGTLYGVCSNCAEQHDMVAELFKDND